MLARTAFLRAGLAAGLLLAIPACKSKDSHAKDPPVATGTGTAAGTATAGTAAPKPDDPPPPIGSDPPPIIGSGADPGAAPQVTNHGDRWKEIDNDGDGEPDATTGGFQMFKEAWFYVDGVPKGVLREVEMPASLPIAWTEQIEYLDFDAGDPGPHERTFLVKRWRISDYIKMLGIPLAKVKMVIAHGGRGVVAIPGDVFRKYADKLRFDLTGNNKMKLRVFLPDGMPRETAYDRYVAISVIVDKPVPTTDESNELVLDGEMIGGIPYFGAPLRGGIRVYVDDKLAMVIKRNQLGDVGRLDGPTPAWNVAKLLEANGVPTKDLVAADIILKETRTRVADLDLATFNFTSSEQQQGKILAGPDNVPTNAIVLYHKGKVPPVWERAPMEKYPDGTIKSVD